MRQGPGVRWARGGRARVGGEVMKVRACSASGRVRAKTVTQSMEAQAGTTPAVGTRPRVGFRPTMPLKAAGTRPEPAVSVPRAKSTMPRATATAEPALEPPLIRSGSWALRTAP